MARVCEAMWLKRTALALMLAVALVFGLFPKPASGAAAPAYASIQIDFCNIDKTKGDWPTPYPGRTRTVQGYIVNGSTMVGLEDLCVTLGAKSTQAGKVFTVVRNYQVSTFTIGSTVVSYRVQYGVFNGETKLVEQFVHRWSAVSSEPGVYINGKPYFSVRTASLVLGCLLVRYKPNPALVQVFDFRVNGRNPLGDLNTYVCGGRWFTDWDSNLTAKVAPHFTIGADKLWSQDTAGDRAYWRQFKMSVSTLQSLENVRTLLGNKSLIPSSGFRSWQHNYAQEGSAARSHHMRGRAFDLGGKAAFDAVFKDIKAVGVPGTSYLRSSNLKSVTQLYEIERMPNSQGSYWLHGQREPGIDQADGP